jgi:hypothetical protein
MLLGVVDTWRLGAAAWGWWAGGSGDAEVRVMQHGSSRDAVKCCEYVAARCSC